MVTTAPFICHSAQRWECCFKISQDYRGGNPPNCYTSPQSTTSCPIYWRIHPASAQPTAYPGDVLEVCRIRVFVQSTGMIWCWYFCWDLCLCYSISGARYPYRETRGAELSSGHTAEPHWQHDRPGGSRFTHSGLHSRGVVLSVQLCLMCGPMP